MSPRSGRPVGSLALPAVVAAAILVLGGSATLLVARFAQTGARERDQRAADLVANSLSAGFQRTLGALRGVSGLAADGEVTDAEFTAFAREARQGSYMTAVAYSQVVPEASRASFEAATGITIRDTDGQGRYLPAAARDQHLVVTRVFPLTDDTRALIGYDLAGDDGRRAAAAASAASGAPALSEPITLASTARPGVFAVHAVRLPDGSVLGYASGGVAVDDLLAAARLVVASRDRVTLDLGDAGATDAPPPPGRRASFSAGGRTLSVTVDDPDDASAWPALLTGAGTVALAAALAMALNRERMLMARIARSRALSEAVGVVARRLASATTVTEIVEIMRTDGARAGGALAVDVVDRSGPTPRPLDAGGPTPRAERARLAQLVDGIDAGGVTRSTGDAAPTGATHAVACASGDPQAGLAVVFHTAGVASSELVATMRALTDTCGQTLTRVRIAERHALIAVRNRAIVTLGQQLAGTARVASVFEDVVAYGGSVLGAATTTAARRWGTGLLVMGDNARRSGAPAEWVPLRADDTTPLRTCCDEARPLYVPAPGRPGDPAVRDGVGASPAARLAAMYLPLVFHDGTCVGALGFSAADGRPFADHDVDAATMVTQLAVRALERALFDELVQDRAERLSLLAQQLASSVTTADLVKVVSEAGPPAVGCAVAVLTPDPSTSRAEVARRPYAAAKGGRGPGPGPAYFRSAAALRRGYPAVTELGERIASVAGALLPVRDDGGRPIATLELTWERPERVTPTLRALLATVVDLVGQTLTRADLHDREHEVIVELQTRLLPPVPTVEGFDIAVQYEPAVSTLGIGGDWYDLVVTDAGTLVAIVGDVTGHGPEAVGCMAQLKALLAHLARVDTPPEVVLEHASVMLAEQHQFATALVIEIDLATGTFAYVNAGHPYPLLTAPGEEPQLLNGGHRSLLGVGAARPVVPGRGTLAVGGSLLLYTDGLIERRRHGLDRQMHRLAAIVADHDPGQASSEMLRSVSLAARRTHEGDGPTDDDVAAILIRRTAAPGADPPPADDVVDVWDAGGAGTGKRSRSDGATTDTHAWQRG